MSTKLTQEIINSYTDKLRGLFKEKGINVSIESSDVSKRMPYEFTLSVSYKNFKIFLFTVYESMALSYEYGYYTEVLDYDYTVYDRLAGLFIPDTSDYNEFTLPYEMHIKNIDNKLAIQQLLARLPYNCVRDLVNFMEEINASPLKDQYTKQLLTGKYTVDSLIYAVHYNERIYARFDNPFAGKVYFTDLITGEQVTDTKLNELLDIKYSLLK